MNDSPPAFIRRCSGCAVRTDGNCLILHLLTILSISNIVNSLSFFLFESIYCHKKRGRREKKKTKILVQYVLQAESSVCVCARVGFALFLSTATHPAPHRADLVTGEKLMQCRQELKYSCNKCVLMPLQNSS
jgi:hypothetical protein